MIGVVGIAEVSVDSERKNMPLNFTKDNLIVETLEKISFATYKIKFLIIINDSPDCQALDDYVSIVRPKLQPNIHGFIHSIEILELKDMGNPPIKHISEIY